MAVASRLSTRRVSVRESKVALSTQSCPLAQGSVSVPVQSPDQSGGLSPQSQPKWVWDWGLSVALGTVCVLDTGACNT